MLAQHAGVDGHVIHTLLGLLFDDFEHQAPPSNPLAVRLMREMAS
jgi:hypothetical protein